MDDETPGGEPETDCERRLREGEKIAAYLNFSSSALPESQTDAYGWPDVDAHFAGWAPTVSSRFTFSMVGEPPNGDTRTANLEESDGTRRVAHIAKRVTRDAFRLSSIRLFQSVHHCYLVGETAPATQLRPNIASRLGLEAEGGDVHRVDIVASSVAPGPGARRRRHEKGPNGGPAVLRSVRADHGKLTGFVFLMLNAGKAPAKDKAAKARLQAYVQLPERIRETVEALLTQTRDSGRHREWNGDQTFMDAATLPIREFLGRVGEEHPLFIARYEIHRSGEVRIFLDRQGLPRIVDIPIAEDVFAKLPDAWKQPRQGNEERPWITGEAEARIFHAERDEFFRGSVDDFVKYHRKRIVEPIFDFIRDMIHRHYHHEAVDDRMVNVRPVERHNDQTWRLETLQWLMTMVQRRRRRGKEPHLRDALGILTYVEAFQTQVASHKRCAENYHTFQENLELRPHSLGHLERSLRTELERREKNRNTNQQLVLMFTSALFAAAAGLLQALSSNQGKIATPDWVGNIARFSALHPGWAVGLWTVAVSFGLCLIYEAVSERLTYGKLLGRMQNVVNAFLAAWAADRRRRKKGLRSSRIRSFLLALLLGAGLTFLAYYFITTAARLVSANDPPVKEQQSGAAAKTETRLPSEPE